MYCPQCESEREEGLAECPECGGTLTAREPGEVEHPKGPLVQAFRTADASLLPVIESVLLGEGIEFLVQGEEGQALFPLGSIGGGPDQRFLGAVVKVRASDAERAKAVLESAAEPSTEEE